MDQSAQISDYIHQCLANGMSPETIKQQLLASGWAPETIDRALGSFQASSPSPHRVRNGVLWIVSPFVILIGISLLQALVHLLHLSQPVAAIFNILSLLIGVAGVILIPVGLIMGILKLTRH